jgi:hypothetical protein
MCTLPLGSRREPHQLENKWIIPVASAGGAVVGALTVSYGVNITSRVPAFALDRAALAHGRYLVAIVPWILSSLYWEIAAKGAAKAKSSESSASRTFHVLLANVAVLLVIAPIRGLGDSCGHPLSAWQRESWWNCWDCFSR